MITVCNAIDCTLQAFEQFETLSDCDEQQKPAKILTC